MILRVNHIQITIPVGMEDKAKYFYCNLLGLVEIEKPATLEINGGFWLQLGKIQIHIGVENSIDRDKTKAHIAYEVTDIDIWRKKLETKNITIIENELIPGFERFEFRDPFGNKIEIMASKV